MAERVRKLEESGVIEGYRASIDPEALGLGVRAIVTIAVRRDSRYEAFLAEVGRLEPVEECHHVTGAASFVLKVYLPTVRDLDALVESLSRFGDTRTSLILSTPVKRRVR